jgi:hypothetical protein
LDEDLLIFNCIILFFNKQKLIELKIKVIIQLSNKNIINLIIMFAKIFAIATIMAAATAGTLYKQCDETWADDYVGTSKRTMCQSGCLVTSIAMALNDNGKTINRKAVDPQTLNKWLKNNGGFVSGNTFVWGSVGKLGMSFVGKFSSLTSIKNYFN